MDSYRPDGPVAASAVISSSSASNTSDNAAEVFAAVSNGAHVRLRSRTEFSLLLHSNYHTTAHSGGVVLPSRRTTYSLVHLPLLKPLFHATANTSTSKASLRTSEQATPQTSLQTSTAPPPPHRHPLSSTLQVYGTYHQR
jgi:hypothetical protein